MTLSDARLLGSIGVAKSLGISLRQLYYWSDVCRVVRPQMRRHGRRVFRRFTERDVRRLRLVKEYLERGYTLRASARMSQDQAGAP
ncbi:MAG TPA: MerR family transcriptional regulator [bacterium]